MAIGSPNLVFDRCGDLAQGLTSRDLHFVVEEVVLSYHQEAEVVLPREGIKEYRAESKKVRDRLWIRRVREDHANPYIPKGEVEKEMRSPKSSKSDASDSEATTLSNQF